MCHVPGKERGGFRACHLTELPSQTLALNPADAPQLGAAHLLRPVAGADGIAQGPATRLAKEATQPGGPASRFPEGAQGAAAQLVRGHGQGGLRQRPGLAAQPGGPASRFPEGPKTIVHGSWWFRVCCTARRASYLTNTAQRTMHRPACAPRVPYNQPPRDSRRPPPCAPTRHMHTTMRFQTPPYISPLAPHTPHPAAHTCHTC